MNGKRMAEQTAKPGVLLVSRLPDSLVGRLRERFDCHFLAALDDAGLAALAPRLRVMRAKLSVITMNCRI